MLFRTLLLRPSTVELLYNLFCMTLPERDICCLIVIVVRTTAFLTMSSSIQATPLSQFSATLLARLPTELNLHILSYCQRNDLICLSLTSHYFRDLVLPMVPKRLSLELYDQNIASQDLRCGCGEKLPTAVERDPRAHRRRQHHFRFEHGTRPHYYIDCRAYPEGHAACKIRGCHHCLCISCPLHTRLRAWIGGDLRYCNECRRFTKRETTKKYKGRCKCKFTRSWLLRIDVKAESPYQVCTGEPKSADRRIITGQPSRASHMGRVGGGAGALRA